jgi:hypothetical protein
MENNSHLCSVKTVRNIRLSILLLLLLPAFPAVAGEPFFCMQPGRTLYYERSDADNGKLRRTTTLHIVSVRPSGNGREVDYTFQLGRPGGSPMFGGPAPMTVTVDADGGARMDLGASLKAVLAGLFPNAEMRSEGTPALLPPGMKPGDRLPDARCTVEVKGAKYRIAVTERRVLREERISTPAGSFDCLVVREHKVERGPGRNRTTDSESWYVAGLGYVRHDTYGKNLRLETTEVLKKY